MKLRQNAGFKKGKALGPSSLCKSYQNAGPERAKLWAPPIYVNRPETQALEGAKLWAPQVFVVDLAKMQALKGPTLRPSCLCESRCRHVLCQRQAKSGIPNTSGGGAAS